MDSRHIHHDQSMDIKGQREEEVKVESLSIWAKWLVGWFDFVMDLEILKIFFLIVQKIISSNNGWEDVAKMDALLLLI